MANNTGDDHENVPNDPRPASSTSLVSTSRELKSKSLIGQSIARITSGLADSDAGTTDVASSTRRVRRGRYFLSRYDQQLHGSMSRPILQYFAHNLSVEDMEYDPISDGDWCFGSHNDFELIPENTPKERWPIYVRTDSGFVKADNQQLGYRKPEEENFLDRLIDLHKDMKVLT